MSEAAELDKDIFSPLPPSSSRQAFVDITLNFGTKDMTDAFPALPAPALAPPNPWKQTTTENQLALRDERLTVSMTDNSYATSLATIQSDMASMLTGIMTANEQERKKERKIYEDREEDHEAQRKRLMTNVIKRDAMISNEWKS